MSSGELTGLDSRVLAVWSFGAAFAATVLGAGVAVASLFLRGIPDWAPALVAAVVFLFGVAHAVARYRRWGFAVREDALYLERGVFTRVRTVVPLVRIQHTDTQRGPVERLVGLSSVVVYTAGSRGADVTVPGLRPADATALQERLKDLAAASTGDDAV